MRKRARARVAERAAEANVALMVVLGAGTLMAAAALVLALLG